MDNTKFINQCVDSNLGKLTKDGALVVSTGESTGRSTKERFVVRQPEVENDIEWGKVNQPISPEFATEFFSRLESKIDEGQTYEMQGYVGSFKVKVKSTSPWHIAFAQNMFRDAVIESLKDQVADDVEITIIHHPYGAVSELGMEHKFEKAIVLDPVALKVGICGTAYAGEIKKSAFTLCNFLMPKYGIFPMHSSANCLQDGTNSSILFGLSGTGKTTLSADPVRFLIGDDEIIWSETGLSNLEGGCYAKLIHLDENKEPEIFKAANRSGAILENVVFKSNEEAIDFDDDTLTENTRGSYCISALEKVFEQSKEASHPQSIVFLTADAFGAFPAVARLDEWQSQYHFISGYTAKVAGTEIGITEPEATFSACFGAPFMPRKASVYAGMLAKMSKKYNVPVWLLNTGWTNGGYGKGERFPISVSRTLLAAIQNGELNNAKMVKHPVFGFEVPVSVPGVDAQYLAIPNNDAVYELARKFQQNAEQIKSSLTSEIVDRGGPLIIN